MTPQNATPQNKRDRLIDAAATLFHRNGLSSTSLADIAKQADIPIGNVYYYFKTKEELALAATGKRKQQFASVYAMLTDTIDDPRSRLVEVVAFFDSMREEYAQHGCPVGKIISDADVNKDPVAQLAVQIWADFTLWATEQFIQLGHEETAKAYAVSLLAGIQGGALLAKALKTPLAFSHESTRLTEWLESLPNRKIKLGKIGMRG